jgi:hypothetical protein
VDRQRVVRLRPLDRERAGLGVHERELEDAADVIVGTPHLAAEGVLGPELEDVARRHGTDRGTPPNVQANSDGSGRKA